ncbi:MAG: hypothetical protein SOW11_05720 [Campylobacter lanienae]|nr:hypothetical protein [Campylobacter lanienae]
MDNELLKILESGGIITFLIAAVFAFFKISKMLYEGRIQDLRESKLQLQHIDLVGEKMDQAIMEIKSSKEAIVVELQKQYLISENNFKHQLEMCKMLEQLANNKLKKIEEDLGQVKNSTKETQSLLQSIRSAQVARIQDSKIKLKN